MNEDELSGKKLDDAFAAKLGWERGKKPDSDREIWLNDGTETGWLATRDDDYIEDRSVRYVRSPLQLWTPSCARYHHGFHIEAYEYAVDATNRILTEHNGAKPHHLWQPVLDDAFNQVGHQYEIIDADVVSARGLDQLETHLRAMLAALAKLSE